MVRKKKIIAFLIFITFGQLVALGFDKLDLLSDLYIPMLIASTIGFLAGYKGRDTKSS